MARYQHRLSGPLLDRIDIFVEVPRIEFEKLAALAPAESSEAVRERVDRCRERQNMRFSEAVTQANSEMTPAEVRDYCQATLDEPSQSLLKLATTQLQLSARAFHRILKVARTIADLACQETIGASHVAEAIQYRQRSRFA